MSKLNELRAQGEAHRRASGHAVNETDTSSYDEVGVTLVCAECDWTVSDEWPRGQYGPTADYGDN